MASFKTSTNEIKQRLRRAKQQASSGRTRINVSGRKNVQIAVNVGRDGGEEHASAVQYAPIEQDGSTS